MSGDGNRRDFLYVATASAGAVTAGAAVWPLVDQMNPSKDVLALATIEVPVGDMEPGSQITVKWRGKPVFIRRRTADEISEARSATLAELPDQSAENDNKHQGLPQNRARDLYRQNTRRRLARFAQG